MTDADCVAFLQWALPRLRMHWSGFRKVRRQVCRRIDRRCAALGLASIADYRRLLETTPGEWTALDELCRVTISRFARDRAIWIELATDMLPDLAREASRAGRTKVRAGSAGCGAGEEPFSLAIAWQLAVAPRWPAIALDVLATDIDEVQLGRAAVATFPSGALRELPDAWRAAAFDRVEDGERLRDRFRAPVHFARHDIRTAPPEGPFDVVLCRNLAFTYFDDSIQREVAASLRAVLRAGGALVVGIHERLPDGVSGFEARSRCIYTAARALQSRAIDQPGADHGDLGSDEQERRYVQTR